MKLNELFFFHVLKIFQSHSHQSVDHLFSLKNVFIYFSITYKRFLISSMFDLFKCIHYFQRPRKTYQFIGNKQNSYKNNLMQ